MLDNINLGHVLFLDIETVSGYKSFEELSSPLQDMWRQKSKYLLKTSGEEPEEDAVKEIFKDKAAIFAEFGKIVCISAGIMVKDQQKNWSVRLKSYASKDEKKLLLAFCELVKQYYHDPNRHYFCGHNIREFDLPYICRRLVINQLPIPNSLNLAGKKPWETKHLLDTMDLWKFGDYKHYTSLKLLAAVLGFPSPKDDIDGSMVGHTFWEEDNLERIAVYCEKDVLAVVQLLLRYMRRPLLTEDQVHQVDFVEVDLL